VLQQSVRQSICLSDRHAPPPVRHVVLCQLHGLAATDEQDACITHIGGQQLGGARGVLQGRGRQAAGWGPGRGGWGEQRGLGAAWGLHGAMQLPAYVQSAHARLLEMHAGLVLLMCATALWLCLKLQQPCIGLVAVDAMAEDVAHSFRSYGLYHASSSVCNKPAAPLLQQQQQPSSAACRWRQHIP
jgi:hypothetical protein